MKWHLLVFHQPSRVPDVELWRISLKMIWSSISLEWFCHTDFKNGCNLSRWQSPMDTFDTRKHLNNQTNSFLSALLKEAMCSFVSLSRRGQKCAYTKRYYVWACVRVGLVMLASSGTERLCAVWHTEGDITACDWTREVMQSFSLFILNRDDDIDHFHIKGF